jgi:hypothetical protein
MHVSLTANQATEHCSQCGGIELVISLSVFTDSQQDDLPTLCAKCLCKPEGIEMKLMLRAPAVEASKQKVLRQQKKRSKAQEKEIAEELGAWTQPGSGNKAYAKGDVRKKGKFLVEAKYTAADSYALHHADLEKIQAECTDLEKPVFVVEYVDKITLRTKDRYAVLPFGELKELLDGAGHHR